MRNLFSLGCIALFCSLQLFASTIEREVTVTVEGNKQSYSLKQKAIRKAKESALKKELLSLNPDMPSKVIEKVQNEPSKYIIMINQLSADWEWLIKDEQGQLVCRYKVVLGQKKLLQYLEENGITANTAKVDIVILEEPPSLGDFEFNKAFGTGIAGKKFFMTNYTKIQRRIRDKIVQNVGKYGLSVKLLTDQDEFKSFKTKDSTLLGVFFDPATDKFAINKDLVDEVKALFPDTIVLYYRLDYLNFDGHENKIAARVALNFKHLAKKTTHSVGNFAYTQPLTSTKKEGVIDGIGTVAENAIQQLLNEAGPKLIHILKTIINSESANDPITISIDGRGIETKYQKRFLYYLKSDFVKKGLADKSSSTIRGVNLTVKTNKKGNPEEVYFETVLPILEKRGMTVDDDKVIFNGSNVRLSPTALDEDK